MWVGECDISKQQNTQKQNGAKKKATKKNCSTLYVWLGGWALELDFVVDAAAAVAAATAVAAAVAVAVAASVAAFYFVLKKFRVLEKSFVASLTSLLASCAFGSFCCKGNEC